MATQAKEVFLTPPLSIAGCQLWLDAADPYGTGAIPSNGSSLLTWNDKSGNGKNAAATGTPTYLTGGGVNFNASPYFLNQNFSQNLSQRSIFIVMQETSRTDVAGVFPLIPTPNSGNDFQTTTGFSIETSSGLCFYGNNGGYASFLGSSSLLVKGIYNDNMNGTTGSGFFNGTNATNVTANYTAGTCSGYGIGGRWIGGSIFGSYRLNGVIYEILFFNTPLITAQRQIIEGYLAWKWGLKNSLPSTHPYSSVSPYQTLTLPIARSVTLKGISFLPTSVSGCLLWLDGNDSTSSSMILSGSSVNTWKDKSGNGYNFTQTSYSTSLPSLSNITTGTGVYFGSLQGLFNTSFPFPTTYTIFSVANQTTNYGGYQYILHSPYNADYIIFFGALNGNFATFTGSGGWNDVNANSPSSSIANTSNTASLVSCTNNGTTLTPYFNAVAMTTKNGANASATGITLGDTDTAHARQPWLGTVGEIIIYTSVLSISQRQQVEGYLAWKWGIQGSLPGTHPYSSVSPSQTLGLPVSRATPFTSFIPTSVSGCQLWLDAADSSRFTYSSGSNISIWADKSPGGNNLTTQSGTPTYTRDGSLNVVNFPSGAILQTSFTFTIKTSSAFFVIAKLTSTSTGYPMILTLIDNNSGDYSIRYSGSVVNYGNSDDIGNGNYYTNGSPNTNASFLNQYVIIDTTTATRAASSRISLSGTFGGRYFIGNIAEVIVYPDGVNSTQRQQLQGYLAWKWGLQQSLPTTHPYYSNPYVPYSLPRVVTKASIQVWSPLRVSGCSMWLDGNDPAGTGAQPSSGATVSTWSDKSGTSNNATSGSATFLKDSLGGYLNFTGSQTYTITNPNVVVNQYFTVFIVEQLQNYTPGPTAGLLAAPNEGPTNTNLVIYYNNSTDASFAFYGNDIYAAVSPAFTTNQAQPTRIWSASFIPNSRNLYINGVSIGADTNNTFLTAWVGARVGYWRYGNYTGKLREIMIYSGIVNTPQRQQIEGYLAWKWGLRSSLPGGHPYINFPPSP